MIQHRRRQYVQPHPDPEMEQYRLEHNAIMAERHPGRPRNALSPNQTTLIVAMNGGVAIRPPRPGPIPRVSNCIC